MLPWEMFLNLILGDAHALHVTLVAGMIYKLEDYNDIVILTNLYAFHIKNLNKFMDLKTLFYVSFETVLLGLINTL
jgi:hypothetical protein